uniref:Uncharacterized protein n=1 Tax=Tanacetum cinerariifolium TaxID=118510 RepID=A0A6L2MFA4_TANCI|nr:hypothetical protein [Tanacetum cinerariifolium]
MNWVLENGSWFIRFAPTILKKRTPNANLLKEDLKSIPIWVKFHDILIVAFTVDGLSVMATKIGNPIMLDSYTVSTCLHSWSRMDYARALIDIRVDRELKEDMVIVIPKMVKVVQDVVGSVSGSPSNTPLVARINDQESQMIEEKLVLLDDGEMEEVYDETTTYMASTSFNVNKASKGGSRERNKSLYKQRQESHGEDPYDDDDFNDPGLIDAQMKFANAFNINLRSQLK